MKKKIKQIIYNSIKKQEIKQLNEIEKVLQILNKVKKIITGEILIPINQDLRNNIFKKEFLTFINSIKL